MRKAAYIPCAIAVAIAFVSCESMAQGAISGALSSLGSSGGSVAVGGAKLGTADFQSGEVLVSDSDSKTMVGQYFYVARIQTPASSATKNQAEALAVSDGSKQWVNYVVNSRKAEKAELVAGLEVFYLSGWAGHDEIGSDSYRKDGWKYGRITSTEELYKGRVEIDGNSYNIAFLRVAIK